MSARLQQLLRRLGVAGVLGVGLLVACAAFWASALAPAREELAARRAAAERLRARAPHQPVLTSGRADEIRRFHGLFPPAESLTEQLRQVHRHARAAGLELAQGEYRLERPLHGLWAYRVTLPVRGTYPQLRGFIAALLAEMHTASVEGLRFERRKAAEAELDAQLRITVYLRPSMEMP
jgi:hypothetical protein